MKIFFYFLFAMGFCGSLIFRWTLNLMFDKFRLDFNFLTVQLSCQVDEEKLRYQFENRILFYLNLIEN
jgi:hypothetical protein